MTSILKVDNIQNSSGTSALSIDSSGNVKPTASGSVVAVRFYSSDTRSTVSAASTGTLLSFTDTKLYGSETDIIVSVNVIGLGNASGATATEIGYDGTKIYSASYDYNGQGYMVTINGNAKFSGVSSGSKPLRVGWTTGSGTASPFNVLNPNSADESRLQQMVSTVVVYEVIA